MSLPNGLRLDASVSAEDETTVVDGLLAFNEARIGPQNWRPVRFVIRDANGTVVAGLVGDIRWRWLYVGKLWVAEEFRGKGLGTQLLHAAEDLARSLECTDVSLDTFEYQARPFYEKLGYRLFGTLEGYPPGYRQFYLTKSLAD